MVACSVFGGQIVTLLTNARIGFSAARGGHFPTPFSMIHISYRTPAASVLWLSISSGMMIFFELDELIGYFSFLMWTFYTLCFITVIWLRYRLPERDHPRAFKVPIVFAYFMTLIGTGLILVPFLTVSQQYVY